jgi:polyisoprenoid-binding protein YceI
MMMARRAWASVAVLGLVSAAGGLAAMAGAGASAPAAAPAAAGTWTIDSVHSNVVYRIKHVGVSNHYGVFFNPEGTLTLGEGEGSVRVTVPLSGLSSGNAKRDQHLRSPDFFNAGEFPTMSFVSTSVKSAGENAYEVTGDLTMLGKARPVTVTLKVLGTGNGPGGGQVMGAEAEFTIKRSEWGMTKYVAEGALGDEVHLTLAIEAGSK